MTLPNTTAGTRAGEAWPGENAPPQSAIRPLVEAAPTPGTLTEVTPGVLWLRLALPFRLNHVNVYLLEDGDGWAVVDTGIDDAPTRAAWQAVMAGPLAGQRLTRLIATHFHPDHFGAGAWLMAEHGLPLHMSAGEYLTSALLQHDPVTPERPAYRAFYRSHGLDETATDRILGQGHRYLRMVSGLPDSYRRLAGGDRIRIGARDFEVLIGSGHAPEQVMLFCREERLFLAADQVLAKISPNISVWPREPEGDPLGGYLASLTRLAALLPEDSLVLPGHGLPFHGLHARLEELRDHHARRCAQVEAACATAPLSVAQLVPVLFDRALDGHESSFAFGEALAHVNHLLARGRLSARRDGEGVIRLSTLRI